MAGAASKWLKGARKIASDALCDLVDECTVEDKAVLSVSAGMLVDTMNSGVGDALLVDATGEGRASKLIHLHKEQAKLSRLDAHPTAPTQPRTSKAAVTMIAAPAALRRAVPETAGGEAILGFYDAFNLRDLDGLGQFITDDCVYEDLLLGAATTISGKQNLLDTLRFHPAFAAQDFSVPLMGRIPPITLQVAQMVEGGDNIIGIEWQAMIGDKELPLGRGLSQVRICPHTGKIERVTDMSEAAWRMLGMLVKPLTPIFEFAEKLTPNILDSLREKENVLVPAVAHGQLVDTTGNGVADSILLDSDGDGRVDEVVRLSDCPTTANQQLGSTSESAFVKPCVPKVALSKVA